MKANVTRRALEARMKRHLAKEGVILRKCKADSRWFNDLGEYYAVDERTNTVVHKDMNIGAWAREVGVLKPFEEVANEE